MGCRSVAGTAPHRFVRQELLSWVSGSAVRQCEADGAPWQILVFFNTFVLLDGKRGAPPEASYLCI